MYGVLSTVPYVNNQDVLDDIMIIISIIVVITINFL